MKKRLAIFGISIVLLFCILGLIAFGISRQPIPFYSSASDMRPHWITGYDEYFAAPGDPLPTLATEPPPPSHTIDKTTKGQIVLRHPLSKRSSRIGTFGPRIPADTKTQSFTLPNGQVIKMVGVAYVPGPDVLYEPNDPERYNNRSEYAWHDPSDLSPIKDPKSLGLPVTTDSYQESEIHFALYCEDEDKKPIRWHWLRGFDENTKRSFGGSASMQKKGSLQLYRVRLNIYNDTPLRLALPISYGEPEVLPFDYLKPENRIEFSGQACEVSAILTQNGRQHSSSSRSDPATKENIRTLKYSPSKPKSNYQQSFTVFKIWPQVQGNTLQIYSPQSKNWGAFHPNSVFEPVSHNYKAEKLGETKWRRFPELACGVFLIPGVPGLPKVDNLFETEIGPQRFRYSGNYKQFISTTTGLQWGYHEKSIPDADFPIEFTDPKTTPADLLRDYQSRIGVELHVDEENQTIGLPPGAWYERFIVWLKKAL